MRDGSYFVRFRYAHCIFPGIIILLLSDLLNFVWFYIHLETSANNIIYLNILHNNMLLFVLTEPSPSVNWIKLFKSNFIKHFFEHIICTVICVWQVSIFLFFFFSFFSFLAFCFLGPYPRHMELPRLGGPVGAVTSSLRHSHSNAGSEPCLQPTPQLKAMPDP